MAEPAGSSVREIDRLKALLFSPEAARIDDLAARLDELDHYVGGRARLEAAAAEVLVEAFRRAEVARHRDLAAAVAPVVVAAIQSEIRNSRDMMVEALYPITGRLVAAAVSNAFRELLDHLNARLDRLTSAQQWSLRIKSILTRRPYAELALAAARRGTIRRILVLERGSGILLGEWARDAAGAGKADLVSGMIAAITEFATTVLSDRNGELRTLDVGSGRLYLRGSARLIVAAEVDGELWPPDERRIDKLFLSLVETHEKGAAVDSDRLAGLAADFTAGAQEKPAGKGKLALAGLVLLALIGWFSADPVRRWLLENRIRAAFAGVTSGEEGAFPLDLSVDHAGHRVSLRGLTHDPALSGRLIAAVQPVAAGYEVETNIPVLVEAGDLRQATSGLEGSLAGARDGVARRFDDAFAQIAAVTKAARDGAVTATATQTSQAELATRLAAAERALADLRAELNSPRRALQDFVAGFAVFFTDEDRLADKAAAAAGLDRLAAMLKDTALGIRIVGYSDEIGTTRANQQVSRRRADVVAGMLIERGIDANRVSVVARADQMAISDAAGPRRAMNRRVVFEMLLAGEAPP